MELSKSLFSSKFIRKFFAHLKKMSNFEADL